MAIPVPYLLGPARARLPPSGMDFFHAPAPLPEEDPPPLPAVSDAEIGAARGYVEAVTRRLDPARLRRRLAPLCSMVPRPRRPCPARPGRARRGLSVRPRRRRKNPAHGRPRTRRHRPRPQARRPDRAAPRRRRPGHRRGARRHPPLPRCAAPTQGAGRRRVLASPAPLHRRRRARSLARPGAAGVRDGAGGPALRAGGARRRRSRVG